MTKIVSTRFFILFFKIKNESENKVIVKVNINK